MEQAAIKWYQYQPKVEVKPQTASRNEYVAWGGFVRCRNISKSILDIIHVLSILGTFLWLLLSVYSNVCIEQLFIQTYIYIVLSNWCSVKDCTDVLNDDTF